MSALHDVANTLESVADRINHQNGYNLFDERRGDTQHVIAEFNAYADQLHAQIETDPMPPQRLLGELTGALNSPERDSAIALIQSDYTRVRESNDFCTKLTENVNDSIRVRVQHCRSGIYMAADCKWKGNERIITGISTNLAGKGEISDRACPVDQRQRPPFQHLAVPAWTSWNGVGGLQIWRYTRMGIGSALYTRVHNIFPNARWHGGTLSQPAHGLRDSLHRRSPWHWEAPHCAVCGRSADSARLAWAESGRNELAVVHADAANHNSAAGSMMLSA